MSIPIKGYYDEYVELGTWKCSHSPSGAHHWIIEGSTMKCKFCHSVRKVPNSTYTGRQFFRK